MKKILLSLFFLTGFFQPLFSESSYSIVFVHIGKELPPYLTVAVAQARLFNQNADIYLIANSCALAHFSEEIADLSIKTIYCESLKESNEHQFFLKRSGLDCEFEDGFWRHASERFFYLDELVTKYGLKNIFHLENDVMLYADLEKLLPIFQNNYKGIAATFDNDERCIPGFIYFSNQISIHRLVCYMAALSIESYNDMEVISKIRNEYARKLIDYLPIIPADYANDHELVSINGSTGKNKTDYYTHIDLFQSIFDAAALGQYLGGTHYIFPPGFINERCVFNPSLFIFKWEIDEEGRKVPFIIYANRRYRINNLHIHSKQLKAFASKDF